jgi:hypothetical protein
MRVGVKMELTCSSLFVGWMDEGKGREILQYRLHTSLMNFSRCTWDCNFYSVEENPLPWWLKRNRIPSGIMGRCV